MKKIISLTMTLAFLISSVVYAHPGRLDANGGHNCSEKSKQKGLCTGYHYHPERSEKSPPTTSKEPAPSKPLVTTKPIQVVVDGNILSLPQDPVIVNGRTMVPLRNIFEALGASVDWDDETKTVSALKDLETIKLTVKETTAFINGDSIILDAPPIIINGRTLVPTRFVASALGAEVGWDDETRTVSIQTAGGTIN